MTKPYRQNKVDRLINPGAKPHEIRCDYAVAPLDRVALDMENNAENLRILFPSCGGIDKVCGSEGVISTSPTLTIDRPLEGPRMADSQHICSIPECGNTAYVRGWCNSHYLRWRRHGAPTGGVKTSHGEPERWLRTLAENPPEECVEWPFAKNGNGYGWAWLCGARIGAHRAALVISTGGNRVGMVAAHKCHNRICVNPRHLEWATSAENSFHRRKDGTASKKLSMAQVAEIKSAKGRVQEIAVAHGVCESTIYKIRAGLHFK